MTERPTHNTDTIHEVPDGSVRSVLVDNLRKSLISVKIRSAEDYNDRTRHLLQQCIDLMPLDDKQLIETQLDDLEQLEKDLEDTRSRFQKFLLIMKYIRVSRQTYLIVKKASNRLINTQIKGRIRASTVPQASPATIPIVVEPPSNPHSPVTAPSPSALDDAAFSNLERAELVTMQSRTTGDPLVIMRLHGSDQRTRQYVATLRPLPPDDGMSDGEGETRFYLRGRDVAETSTVRSSEYGGSSSDPGAGN